MWKVYEKLEKLGSGTYGVVYKARGLIDKEIYAIKEIDIDQPEGIPPSTIREVSLLKELKHPNIVDLKEVLYYSNSIYMVLEFLEKDLKNFIDMKRNMSQILIKSYAYQMLSGVCFCHCHGIIHRDLKPSNILINRLGLLKICDFGLSRMFSLPMRPYTKSMVTLWYRAPEILFDSPLYSIAIDIWSVGCIIAEMINLKPLFTGNSELAQIISIMGSLGKPPDGLFEGADQVLQEITIPIPENGTDFRSLIDTTDEDAIDLISKMLKYDPNERISAIEALNHPFFVDLPESVKNTCIPSEIKDDLFYCYIFPNH